MAIFSLFFLDYSLPELNATVLKHPLLPGEIRAARGASSEEAVGRFSWSRAVRALSIFFLNSAAVLSSDVNKTSTSIYHGSIEQYVMEGEADSPASALDYAISKSPQWLEDMFGVTRRGDSLLKLMIVRSNPERKRAGPVSISLNIHNPPEIIVYLNGTRIDNSAILIKMANSIEREWRYSARISSVSPQTLDWLTATGVEAHS